MPRVVSFGEALIDIFAGNGVTLRELKPLHPLPGGAPANFAVARARLGVEDGFYGRVGDDGYGHFLIDPLRREGVLSLTFAPTDEGRATMLAILDAPNTTEQHFVLYYGADALRRPDEGTSRNFRDLGGHQCRLGPVVSEYLKAEKYRSLPDFQ